MTGGSRDHLPNARESRGAGFPWQQDKRYNRMIRNILVMY